MLAAVGAGHYRLGMKIVPLLSALLLVGACTQTTIVRVGPNRHRVAAENIWAPGGAEAAAADAAQRHCAGSGRVAEIKDLAAGVSQTRTVEFECVRMP
jgi:hypothetical protein